MKTSTPEETKITYYNSRESVGVWNALIVCFALIIGGASMAARSFTLTFCLLFGTGAVWYVGYWLLSRSCYFISSTAAGFKDIFVTREVRFDEVKSATKSAGRYSSNLIFMCNTKTVAMPLDPIDETWFTAVRTELLKRGITVSSTVFGIVVKDK